MSSVKPPRSRSCFVFGCNSGTGTNRKFRKDRGETCPSLFRVPKHPEMLKLWQQAVSRSDKILGYNNAVCELHFQEEDILRYYETILSDGTVSRIERGRPKLRPGSIPSKFHISTSYSSYRRKRRKRLEMKGLVNNQRTKCVPLTETFSDSKFKDELQDFNLEQTEPIKHKTPADLLKDAKLIKDETPDDSSEENINVSVDVETNRCFAMFEDLKTSLNKISTPNKMWSGTFIPGKHKVLFAEWNDSYTTTKKIVIDQDMSFKVYFGKASIIVGTITSIPELESLLKSINNLRIYSICSGFKLMPL